MEIIPVSSALCTHGDYLSRNHIYVYRGYERVAKATNNIYNLQLLGSYGKSEFELDPD
jgi:hypothetical protein